MKRKKAKITSTIKFKDQAQAQTNNPTLTNLEFVFTDNLPNANAQGVKASTFDSLIKTGKFMPIKMVKGALEGHTESVPIGVIQDFEKVTGEDESHKTLVGKAGLWSREFEEEIQLIKEAYASDSDSINISWELMYTESEIDADQIEWLTDPIVRAATVVGEFPAYEGRTPLLSVAQRKYMEKNMDLEQALNRIKELEINAAKFDSELGTLRTQLTEKEEALAEVNSSVADNLPKLEEYDGLKQFKLDAEAKQVQAELLVSRLKAFSDAGIEFSEEEVESRKSAWLSMEDSPFDFLVSELSEAKKLAQASLEESGKEVPGPVGRTKKAKKESRELLLSGFRKALDKERASE